MKIAGAVTKYGSGGYVDLSEQESAAVANKASEAAEMVATIACVPLALGIFASMLESSNRSYLEEKKREEARVRRLQQTPEGREQLAREQAEKTRLQKEYYRSCNRMPGSLVFALMLFVLFSLTMVVLSIQSYFDRRPAVDPSMVCNDFDKHEMTRPGQDLYPEFSEVFPGSHPEKFAYSHKDGFLVGLGGTPEVGKPYLDCRGRNVNYFKDGTADVKDCRLCQPKPPCRRRFCWGPWS